MKQSEAEALVTALCNTVCFEEGYRAQLHTYLPTSAEAHTLRSGLITAQEDTNRLRKEMADLLVTAKKEESE